MSNGEIRGCSWEDVESALRRGWHVFPLWGVRGVEGQRGVCACPKAEGCDAPGKHPAVSGGLLAAVGESDAFQAATWWADGAERRNLGIRTGSVSGLLVTDVDIRSGGADSYDAWEDVTGFAWPVGARVRTGRGGAEDAGAGGHWYTRWSREWTRLGRKLSGKVGVLPGIDVRADGGYVVGVGSAHISGGRYQWTSEWAGLGIGDGTGREIPEAPLELFEWLRDARSGRGVGLGSGGTGGAAGGVKVEGYSFKETRKAPTVGAGGRDAYFNDLAFRLRLARFSWDRALSEVRREWDRTEQPMGDEYAWETALGKLERVWETIPEGGHPQEGSMAVSPKTTVPPPVRTPVRAPVATPAPAPSAIQRVPPAPMRESRSASSTEGAARVDQGAILIGDILDKLAKPNIGKDPATAPGGRAGAGGSGGDGGDALEGEVVHGSAEGEENHDTGNGLRYVRLFRDRARYVREMAQWFLWDETDGIWRLDRIGRSLEWTKQVVGDIRAEADMARLSGDTEAASTWYQWAHRTSSMARRRTLLESASVEDGIRTEVEELDAGRWLMALRGGQTVDLETGKVRASRPSDLVTKVAGVSWDEVAAVGREGWRGGAWEQHVLRMVKGDQEAAGWLRRMAGYCLTGSVEEQVMSLLHGNGENGKNVFMETLCAVWGGYAIKAQAGILTAADDEHPVGLYGLRGARLVFVDEVGRARINETRLKDITGGAILRARDIGQSWVEFEMQGKVWVAANSLPAIRDSSHGMWRRIRRVELYGKVGADGWVRENGFAERLQRACRGEVMAWALSGLEEWRTTGLGTYNEMELMSAQYRDEEDLFGLFIRECLVVNPVSPHSLAEPTEQAHPTDWTDQRKLYSAYTFWCATSLSKNEKVLNYSYFGRELRKALPDIKTERGREDGERVQRVYGVRLKSVM